MATPIPFMPWNTNLKHKAKSILELLTNKIVKVPEWQSYSFDINLLENLWQDLKWLSSNDQQQI
jgi:hypothetical protein